MSKEIIAADDPVAIILDGMSTVFESLGRALICLDHNFQIVHASESLDNLVGEGAVQQITGKPAEEVLGSELFGPEANLRLALARGERREGWGATISIGQRTPMMVSLTGAPLRHRPGGACDPRVSFILVLRPPEESEESGSSGPTLFSGLVARSQAMLHIFRLTEQLGESDATALITGESGTGKELVARALHVHSPRHAGPFVAVNCGALPGELLESELFGHIRGAFTGAVRDRIGRFELAKEGTIFLDEIGDLPALLQVKLLRVLQEKTFERVGESTSRQSGARVIAATNQDLRRSITEGTFREDLYYRLRVVPIHIPPLRERREDVEPLARHLLGRVSRRHDRLVRLSPDALRYFLRYAWPGNVRELENALEYAIAVSRGQTIHAQDLPQEILNSGEATSAGQSRPGELPQSGFGPTLEHAESSELSERERLRLVLEAHQWRRTNAAKALGISRTTLWRKMRELNLLRR